MIYSTTVRGQLLSTVEQIWSSYIGRGLIVAPSEILDMQMHVIRGEVDIEGVWTGCLRMECSNALAVDVARSMLGVASEALTQGEIFDAWGEVTNMVGGGLKHTLPSTCRVSIPRVESMNRTETHRPREHEHSCVGFLCETEPFRVMLFERGNYESLDRG